MATTTRATAGNPRSGAESAYTVSDGTASGDTASADDVFAATGAAGPGFAAAGSGGSVSAANTSVTNDSSAAAALSAKGLAAAAAAFTVWGLFPLYFKPLHDVSAFQIIAHRVVWSCVFVLGWMAARGELGKLRETLADPGVVWRLAVTATLITINWIVYVWAVGHGHVVEASLGYFINPLVNVLLGVIVLSERLNRAQWISVGLAAIGVAYLTFVTGSVPWISLTLAISFGLYGLMRKVIRVDSLPGLATETLLLVPFATAYLIVCEATGTGAMGHSGRVIDALLIGSGPLTAISLFLFAYGARRIPYSTVGLLQYIAPTLQLACGVFAFHEPFERTRAAGFALIWLALVIYAGDGLWRARREAASRT